MSWGEPKGPARDERSISSSMSFTAPASGSPRRGPVHDRGHAPRQELERELLNRARRFIARPEVDS